jgi:TonB family protein
MNAQHLGIVTSLAIHGGFLALLLTIPVANVIPYTKTIYISFAQQETLPSTSQRETKAIMRPQAENEQSISKPEAVEVKHRQADAIVKETLILSIGQKAENHSPVKTVIASLEKAGSQKIIETKFGNAGAPVFIHREMPIYPILARRLGKEGNVVLKLLIDTAGKLQNIEVIEPSWFGFTEATIEAIQKSTFSPAHKNGEKIVSKAILSVRFKLE